MLKSLVIFAGLLMAGLPAAQGAAKVPEAQPGRVVIIGDAHGDFQQYVALLQEAELINERGSWTGDQAVLVQLGDVVDRGDESRKILDLLKSLQKQAPRDGGSVQFVIGNHEAMNMKGDLRYVTAGEFASYKTPTSSKLRNDYYERYKTYLKGHLEGGKMLTFDDAFRTEWDDSHPLGWVEQRQAWAPDGVYGGWVLDQKAVAKVGNLLFVHGGISPKYAGSSIQKINDAVYKDLKAGQDVEATITNEADGPMWYRGMALNPENQERANVDAVLKHYGVDHVITGHTPLTEAITPRFGGKVIVADVGLADYYGGAFAYVEVIDGVIYANQRGQRMVIPMQEGAPLKAYLEEARALEDDPKRLNAYIEELFPSE